MNAHVTRFVIGFVFLGSVLALLGYTGAVRRLNAGHAARPTRHGTGDTAGELFPARIEELLYSNDNEAVVILKAGGHAKPYLIMGIGICEARAIDLGTRRQYTPRPLTHDLVTRVTHALGAHVEKLVIEKFEDDVFLGTLYLATADGRQASVDTRPSDGLAVALRADVPVFVAGKVLDEAGHAEMDIGDTQPSHEPDMVEKTLRNL
ncbi:MAG: bifunctional nuclease family protein [Planctomycetes bacterium]|nr:bifunctional nuclease family protein [Planctomycetota bacterium]